MGKMDASSKDGFLALIGLLSVVYGFGMAFLAWRGNPKSLYYAIFKPRWCFGVKASRFAAFVQVPIFLSLGGLFLCGAFHFRHAQMFAMALSVAAVFSVYLFLADWVSADET